jgi:heme exporter protein C
VNDDRSALASPPPLPSRGPAPFILIGLAVLCLAFGSYYGLSIAPPERYMGDVQRIMYIHVPTAWNAMLAFTWAFVCALMFLFRGTWPWDSRLEAGIEVGVILTFLLCVQGAVWAKPTWGVWWDWDPRLTTSAVLLVAFVAILALRHFVDEPVKRGTWASVATIIAYVDVPIVYLSVKWWNTLHQMQSTPNTVSAAFYLPLRMNAFGVLFLMIGLLITRARVAQLRLRSELAEPVPDPVRGAELATRVAS